MDFMLSADRSNDAHAMFWERKTYPRSLAAFLGLQRLLLTVTFSAWASREQQTASHNVGYLRMLSSGTKGLHAATCDCDAA